MIKIDGIDHEFRSMCLKYGDRVTTSRVGDLGSGSDHTSFIHCLGIPSLDMTYKSAEVRSLHVALRESK